MASLETHTIEVSQAYPAAACSCIPEAASSRGRERVVHSGAVRETKTYQLCLERLPFPNYISGA